LGGANLSPKLALLILHAVIHKWNLRIGITHLGMPDWSTSDTVEIQNLKALDTSLGLLSASKYKDYVDPNDFLDTNETFGFVSQQSIKRAAEVMGATAASNIDEVLAQLPEEDDDDTAEDLDTFVSSLFNMGADSDEEDEEDPEQDPCRLPSQTMKQHEKDVYTLWGLPPNVREIGLVDPHKPFKDELTLYDDLYKRCVSTGGRSIDLDKMVREWNKFAVDQRGDGQGGDGGVALKQLKNVRCLHRTSLELLTKFRQQESERKQVGKTIEQTDTQQLRGDLRGGDRPGTHFREAATPSLPAQSPAVTPHPHALASSAIYYAPSYAGRSRLSNPWPLVGEILPTVVEEGAGKRKRGGQLCTVCGHEKSSQKWKDLHGPKTCCKHSEACKASNGIQCRLVAAPPHSQGSLRVSLSAWSAAMPTRC